MNIVLHSIKLLQFQPIVNHKNHMNNAFMPLGFKGSPSGDRVEIKKPSSFGANTYIYLTNLSNHLLSQYIDTKNIRLPDIDPYKISDICEGIDVFKGWDAKDLMLIGNNLNGISLSKGCYHQCGHCFFSAGKKVSMIEWNNYKDLIDGMKELKDRLYFNPFVLSVDNSLFPFHDSDPLSLRSVDSKTKEVHGIYDAVKYLHDKTNIRYNLTTAGWEKENKVSQTSAENIAKNLDLIERLTISIHPFHGYMQKSIENLEKGDRNQANFWRNKYIDMMANVLETLAPAIEKGHLSICLEYTTDKTLNYSSENDAIKLLSDIQEKIKADAPDIYDLYSSKNLERKQNIEFRDIQILGNAKTLVKSNSPEHTPKYKLDSLDAETIYKLPKIILPDGTILVCLNETTLHNEFAAFPKKLNFKNSTNLKSDINYPIIQESQLVYKVPDRIKKRDIEIEEIYSETTPLLRAKFEKRQRSLYQY